MSAPLRLIQVGAGGMGRAWLRTITADAEVELVGLVDLDTARAAAALAELPGPATGVTVAPSLTALGDVGADAVVNVTVPAAHLPVTAEALALGLPVLCEKPLSESLSECLRMAAMSQVSGRLIMVSQSRRYWRAVAALRRELPAIGPVELAACEFARGPHFGGFREEMAHPLLVDMAIHQFDLARLLIGAEPVDVVAQSWNPSWSWYAGDACATATFGFDSGARFGYTGSWCSPGLETSWNGAWRLSGPAGTAVWDGDGAPRLQLAESEPQTLPLGDEPEQIAGSLAEFVQALRTGATPAGEVHSNLTSVAMVLAAVRSADTGQRVVLAELITEASEQALATEPDADVRAVLHAGR